MRSSARVWPSQTPKLISRRRGSTVTAAEGRSSSAVRRARAADWTGAASRRPAAAGASAALGLAGSAQRRVGQALQAPLFVPSGGRMAQDGEGHAAHRRVRIGRRGSARAAARSSWCAGDPCLAAAAKACALGRSVEQPGDGRGEGCAHPDGVSNPVMPSATTAGTPPVRPATTGRPAAWASRKAMP